MRELIFLAVLILASFSGALYFVATLARGLGYHW